MAMACGTLGSYGVVSRLPEEIRFLKEVQLVEEEDLPGICWEIALRALKGYRERVRPFEENFKAFLWYFLKREFRKTFLKTEPNLAYVEPPEPESPEAQLNELCDLSRQPPWRRHLLNLALVEEMSVREIGKACSIPKSTVHLELQQLGIKEIQCERQQ